MANVKISELPALSELASDDIIIVNDASDSTTKKFTLSNIGQSYNGKVSPPTGVTANTSDGKIPFTVTQIGAKLVSVSISLGGVTLTNTTGSNVRFKFPVLGISGGASVATHVGFIPTEMSLQDGTRYTPIARGNYEGIWGGFLSASYNANTGVITTAYYDGAITANNSITFGQYNSLSGLFNTEYPYNAKNIATNTV